MKGLLGGLVAGALLALGVVSLVGNPGGAAPEAPELEDRRRAEELIALDPAELLKRKDEADELRGLEGKAVLALIACAASRARQVEAGPKAAETCSIAPAAEASPVQEAASSSRVVAQSAADANRSVDPGEGARKDPVAVAKASLVGSADGVTTQGPLEIRLDPTRPYKGRASTVVRSLAQDDKTVTVVTRETPAAPFRGRRVKYTATLVLEEVLGHAVLWMRVEDSYRKVLGSKTLFLDQEAARRRVAGFEKYKLTANVPAEAETVIFGLLMAGGGVIRTGEVLLKGEPEAAGEAGVRFELAGAGP